MTGMDAYRLLYRELEPFTESPSFEAFEMLSFCTGLTRTQILAGAFGLTEEQTAAVDRVLRRRLQREPLQYILGEWTFFGRPFAVGEGVLIPRADTETLVEAAISAAKPMQNPKIADLCAGSGCIAVTLSLELETEVDAYEKSDAAFAYLTENIKKNGAKVNAIRYDVLQEPDKKYDLIVSNPPYLTKEDMAHLQKEVSFEPEMALFGGDDGLDFYRAITKVWKNTLLPGGMLFYEVGAGQADDVAAILAENGFTDICTYKDLCGIIRVVGGKR